MIQKRKNIEFFILLFLNGVLLVNMMYDNIKNYYGEFRISNFSYWIIIFLMSRLLYISTKSKNKNKVILVYFLITAGIIIFLTRKYSPIDEAAHFDYINYIINNHRIPTLYENLNANELSSVFLGNIPGDVINHEAVQPPLYYVIIALLTFYIKNLKVRLIVIRFIGIACLYSIYIISIKTIQFLRKQNVLKADDYVINIVIYLILFNPGIILRMSYVSNEPLAALLASIFMYYILKLIVSGWSQNYFTKCIIILIALLLTKTTTIFFIGLAIIVIFYYKKIRVFVISIFSMMICMLPWFIFNIKNYGKLTGMSEHVKFVLPIVNPQNVSINILESTITIFNTYFIQEYTLDMVGTMILYSISIMLIYVCISGIIYTFKKIYILLIKDRFNFSYSVDEKKIIFKIIIFSSLILNILVLVFGSITTKVNVMIGRYLYLSAIPLICILITIISEIKEYKKIICIYFCIFLSIANINLIKSLFNQNNWILGIMATSLEEINIDTNYKFNQYNDINIVEEENYFKLKCGSVDPQLEIDRKDCGKVGKIKIIYSSNCQGTLQLYYKQDIEGFNETNSIKQNINSGVDNVVCLDINSYVKSVRIDPPNGCEITIKKIEFFN